MAPWLVEPTQSSWVALEWHPYSFSSVYHFVSLLCYLWFLSLRKIHCRWGLQLSAFSSLVWAILCSLIFCHLLADYRHQLLIELSAISLILLLPSWRLSLCSLHHVALSFLLVSLLVCSQRPNLQLPNLLVSFLLTRLLPYFIRTWQTSCHLQAACPPQLLAVLSVAFSGLQLPSLQPSLCF